MKTTELIRNKACELEEDFWWRALRFEKELKKYFKNDWVSLRWGVQYDRVKEELDSMDFDFIFQEKRVWEVQYLYMWGKEVWAV